MYMCGDWACICVFVFIYKSEGVYDSVSALFVGMCGYLHVCVCLCAHLWPMCMAVNLSDCLCVCVRVCFPHLAPCSRSWACNPRLGFLCDNLQHKQGDCCSICCLARCTAAPMAAELLSVLTFHHPRDSNRSAEKMYLPPYSSEWPTTARKWNSSWVIPAAGNLNISPVVFTGLLGGRLSL